MESLFKWAFLSRDIISNFKKSIFLFFMCITLIVLNKIYVPFFILKLLFLIVILLYLIPVCLMLMLCLYVIMSGDNNTAYISYHLKKFSKQKFLLFPSDDKRSVYKNDGDIIKIPATVVGEILLVPLKYFNILKSAKLTDDVRTRCIISYDDNIDDISLNKHQTNIDVYVSKKSSVYPKLKLMV